MRQHGQSHRHEGAASAELQAMARPVVPVVLRLQRNCLRRRQLQQRAACQLMSQLYNFVSLPGNACGSNDLCCRWQACKVGSCLMCTTLRGQQQVSVLCKTCHR